jgi:hypothetical protein
LPTSQFDQLPLELIEEIFGYSDLPTLLSAAQVSSRWQNFACLNSLRIPFYEKAHPQRFPTKGDLKNSTNDGSWKNWRDLRRLEYTSPSYKPQWHVEDYILSRRLNKKIIDGELNSLTALYSHHKLNNVDVQKYIIKTRLKWKSADEKNIYFEPAKAYYFGMTVKIPRNQIDTANNIGEEYEIISDYRFSNYYTPFFDKLHRLRITKFLDWKIGLLMIITLLYAPILVMDIMELPTQNTRDPSRVAGVTASFVLIAVFGRICTRSMRARPILFKIVTTSVIALLLFFYFKLVRLHVEFWIANGIFWMMIGCIDSYGRLFQAFWFRRHYFGLKIVHAISLAITILLLYAINWSLLMECILTNRIWRTMGVYLMQAWAMKIQMCAVEFIKLTIERDLIPQLDYIFGIGKGITRSLFEGKQYILILICAVYAPAGFALDS